MSKKDVTIKDVYELIIALREEIREIYVTKDEFGPVKAVVYGLVTLIITGVVTALLATVIKAALL